MEPNVGDKDLVEESKEGMSFSSVEKVRAYYTKYAKQVGFGVTKRSSKVGDNGKVRYFTLACVRQGTSTSTSSNILKPRPMEHNGCKAKINAILDSEGEFCLTHVVLEHTHALSPGKARYIRCHKRLDEPMKRRLEYNDMAGIQLSKNYNSCVVEAGGHKMMVSIMSWTLTMKPDYAMYFGWMHVRSRAAYKSFGDVITFDTAYLTNAYKMPFAPFVDVNHHEAIITDQDKAMRNAIAKVFPKSRHRFCLWHIMKKVPEKFRSHSQYDGIKSQLHRCVYDTLTPDEFECCWLQFLDNFDLHDNPWLEWLYSKRHLWVLVIELKYCMF
ncbi:protein FAR1-RELATED SEQUENCE 5-like [Carya illinoinensis]|uniref:protein FAR1-RELATED SEQUENCE 5-like n=1 Tax=Carya illinoinensis TaxID=32201 RepID=UPI001C71C83C|nr:protein FAR1-RELATED SEQUENCE 5-like [Carya illinoinensis]